ncbi:MAG: hypothetical protein ACI3XM_11200, partial [Eubacteriales bacterium]
YMLIRPLSPEYLHPVILRALRLERAELASAPDFPTFCAAFRAFASSSGRTPAICTWGCADRSALLQNIRIKGGCDPEQTDLLLSAMRDLQPLLCRAAGLHQPYPGLSSLLSHLQLETGSRHNALSDAEDTARIAAYLAAQSQSALASLFSDTHNQQAVRITADGNSSNTSQEDNTEPQNKMLTPEFARPAEVWNHVRSMRLVCPVCRRPVGTGTWIRVSPDEKMTLCSCETDGRFLCAVQLRSGKECAFSAALTLVPFMEPHKARYEAARRAERLRRMRKQQNKTAAPTVPQNADADKTAPHADAVEYVLHADAVESAPHADAGEKESAAQ